MEDYSFDDVLKIINIFDKYHLNTTKQLDYLVLKKKPIFYMLIIKKESSGALT